MITLGLFAEFANLRQELGAFLKAKGEAGEVITAADVHEFFARMNAKRARRQEQLQQYSGAHTL